MKQKLVEDREDPIVRISFTSQAYSLNQCVTVAPLFAFKASALIPLRPNILRVITAHTGGFQQMLTPF